ncbi:MAG TPA: MFS transporter [Acidimicrobiales bacterium]|jgi:EmrB/QacA subfamily drug resistance transporter|nr:MFS transporter [Acidimicrobiales bacterium]
MTSSADIDGGTDSSFTLVAGEPDPRRFKALAVIATAQLMIALDVSVATIALPPAQQALHISVANRQWALTAYTLAFGGLLLLGGRIADYLGRKRVLIWSLVGFGIASALGGLAQDQAMLFAARALQGAMAAMMAPAALSLITVTFTEERERHKAFGVYGAVSGAGAAVGLILGGLLTQYVSWRWNLLITAPIAIVAALAAAREVTESRAERRSGYDIPGAVTVTAGLLAVVYGFTRAATDGWGSSVTLTFLLVGAVLLVIFTLIESKVANPLLPLRVVLDRNRGASFLAVMLLGASTVATWLFLTYYFEQNLGYSAIKTGLAFLPLSASVVVGVTISTRLMARVGARYLTAGAFALATIGLVIYTQIQAHSSYPALILPAMILWGLGFGGAFVVLSNTALLGVTHHDAGVASALVNATQQVGGTIGVAVLNTIAASVTANYLSNHHHGPTTQAAAAAQGYTIAFIVAAALFGAGAIMCLLSLRASHNPATAELQLDLI